MATEGRAVRDPLAETLDKLLRPAELRKQIRIHILSGRVDEAIELLHIHFPTVLPQDSNPHQHETEIPLPSDPPSSSESFTFTSSTSVDPTHLLLNLRILGFSEAARTVPLSYHPPGEPLPASPASPAISETKKDTGDPELSEQQLILLHKAQKLYSEANCLPKPADRATYLKELAQVSALLAYPNPENSIMAPFLAQDRREAVADQVERAILHCRGESLVSHLEILARYNTVIWGNLHDHNIRVPPPTKWPPGVQLPPSALSLRSWVGTKIQESSAGDKTPSGKKPSEKESERAPTFSLTEFLNAKA
ncbi:hypothetical protein PHLCEN_2v7744 [Hermanssonia centrifuga]|uniref:CRA domain-containing protein n=1 Tax=Hermanssonia centrifuga TaxID=98765 RepID=A0A2R6NVE0_9APHY|nr:hypothetical protein PHLCEN_2v7744 [Hermanssonia centrifuga]